MLKPKAGKTYQFVRVENGRVAERTGYTRYYDGSAGTGTSDDFGTSFDNDPNAWKLALQSLESLGFVEEQEAKTHGILLEGIL